MESYRANILQDGEVIIDDVVVWLNESDNGDLSSWEGHFDIKRSTDPIEDLLSGKFRIVLADGREGEFFVTNISTGSESETGVDFQGTGPLQ